jgi:Ice-binding-like
LTGDASAVFIFQAGSTLVTDPDTTIKLAGGAQACNVGGGPSTPPGGGGGPTTAPTPKPKPTPTPAPVPSPVGTTFPVTG